MDINDTSKVLTNLFVSPTEAVVLAASEQRRIWIIWLKDIQRLLQALPDGDNDAASTLISGHMRLAPVWKMSAQISVGMTMRIASINRMDGEASIGFGLGLLQASGNFGFMSESSSESVFQAQASYALSNESEITLVDYLSTLGVTPASPSDLQTAIDKLSLASTPISE